MNRRYYSGLDLLRFLAAVAVAFFFHYVIMFGDTPAKDNAVCDFLNLYGGYVVELFFVISGFVIYNAYAQRIRDGKTVFTRFLVDRVIRLYPAVITSVIVIWIIMWVGYAILGEAITDNANVSVIAIILNLAGLNGGTLEEAAGMSVNGPTWYISVLMVCYLLFYGVIKLCKKSRGAENVCFIIIITIGIFIYFNPIELPFLLMSSARGYVFFFLGVLIAQLHQKVNLVGNILLCLASIGLVFMYIFEKNYDFIFNDSLEVGLAIIVPIVVFFINFTPLEFICNNVVVKFLGGISYGVFLWNMPVYIGVIFVSKVWDLDFDYGDILTYLVIVGINVVCGVMSYILLDKLLVKKLKKIRERNEIRSEESTQQ